jgi:hypothetical protein
MTSPDQHDRGLDPAHILSVCTEATAVPRNVQPAPTVTGSAPPRQPSRTARPGHRLSVTATEEGVLLSLPTRRTALSARAALAQVGYRTVLDTSAGRGREILVTEWGMVSLEIRLHAMRDVLRDLARDPAPVASAVIGRIRRAPAGSAAAGPDAGVLAELRMEMHTWVSARSGIHAPHDPAIVPADPDIAVRLRTTWTLETAIDNLTEHHLQVAGHAAGRFAGLRQQLGDDGAEETAVLQTADAFRVSSPAAQDLPARDPAAPARRPARSRAHGLPPGAAPRSQPGLSAEPGPRPGGGHFPARRPGLNR